MALLFNDINVSWQKFSFASEKIWSNKCEKITVLPTLHSQIT